MEQPPPDLNTRDRRRRYKRELREVAQGQQELGLVLATAAIAIFLLPQLTGRSQLWGVSTLLIGWILLAVAWLFLIYTMVARTGHHRRRMARQRAEGEDGGGVDGA